MGVAFELEVTRSRAESRLDSAAWGVAALGVLCASMHLAAGPVFLSAGAPEWRAMLAAAAAVVSLAAGLLAFARWFRPGSGRVRDATSLRVDDDGGLALQRPGEPPRPMALRATCALPGLTLLVVAPYPGQAGGTGRGRPVALRIGRDAVTAEGWRRLHVWLRWIERGRPGP